MAFHSGTPASIPFYGCCSQWLKTTDFSMHTSRYHSTTYALFPDETHTSIRRTFNSPLDHPLLPPTRRQFCGYCGTHLSAWNEADAGDSLDVTLGSLLNDSLLKLEALNIIPDTEEDDKEDGLVKGGWIDDEEHIPMNKNEHSGLVKGGWIDDETHIPITTAKPDGEGLVKGGWVDDEEHIPMNKNEHGGLVKGGWIDDETHIPMTSSKPDSQGLVKGGWLDNEEHIPVHNEKGELMTDIQRTGASRDSTAVRRMQNRGIPYFEEMVENSRLGRIKRQKGGHTSQDGRMTVQWEVVEIDNTEPSSPMDAEPDAGVETRAKRQKMSS